MKGILGIKAGMTQIYLKDGRAVPVTVIQVKPNVVTQIKTKESDKYDSIQLSISDKKDARATKAHLGHMKKANTGAKYHMKEVRGFVLEGATLGQEVKLDTFSVGEFVDVQGTSKGKGFQGNIKRWNQAVGPMAHGSLYHRGVGSMGDIASAVKKSKRMPGHMGHATSTVQNLEIMAIDIENEAILVKGSIPGPNRSLVLIKTNIKGKKAKEAAQLVNVSEETEKNKLIAEGAKVDAVMNSEMSIEELKETLVTATETFKAAKEARKSLEDEAKKLGVKNPEKLSDEDLKRDVDGLKSQATEEAKPEAEEEVKVEESKEEVKPEITPEVKTEEKAPEADKKDDNSSEEKKEG